MIRRNHDNLVTRPVYHRGTSAAAAPAKPKRKRRYRAIALRCRIAKDGLVFGRIYLGWAYEYGTGARSRCATTFMIDQDGIARKRGAHLFDPVNEEHVHKFWHHVNGDAAREPGWYARVAAACLEVAA